MDKTCKHSLIFQKMVVNSYANHVLSIFKCMPQHFIHTMYTMYTTCTLFILCILCMLHTMYTTFHYKRYTKYKYIVYNYAALQNNPKARNYSDSEVSQHGKRNSL